MRHTFGGERVSVDDESAAHEELARCLLRSYPTVAAPVFDIRNGEPRLAIVAGKATPSIGIWAAVTPTRSKFSSTSGAATDELSISS